MTSAAAADRPSVLMTSATAVSRNTNRVDASGSTQVNSACFAREEKVWGGGGGGAGIKQVWEGNRSGKGSQKTDSSATAVRRKTHRVEAWVLGEQCLFKGRPQERAGNAGR